MFHFGTLLIMKKMQAKHGIVRTLLSQNFDSSVSFRPAFFSYCFTYSTKCFFASLISAVYKSCIFFFQRYLIVE